jgi:hypothetical protein
MWQKWNILFVRYDMNKYFYGFEEKIKDGNEK